MLGERGRGGGTSEEMAENEPLFSWQCERSA